MGFAGIRDPHLVRNVDKVVEWSRASTARIFGKDRYELFFHVFGKNGVLKELEPVKDSKAHELGVVVEVVADDDALAQKITDFALRMFSSRAFPA